MPTPFEALRFISLVDEDDKHIKLERITREYYETQFVDDPDSESQPTHYFRESDDYILHPTPDKVRTLVIGYWGIFSNLSSSNTAPEMPQVWHEILLYGAIRRGWLRYNDFVRAQYWEALQMRALANIKPTQAKEEADSRLSGIDIPVELMKYP